MSLLSKLTLVIPTYKNRQGYALRNMRYWSGSEVTVHVLDGSAEAIKPAQIDELSSNIHYHHFPVSLLIRFNKVKDLVKTKYVSFLADDEFFMPSAVEASILELEKDDRLVACCGQTIGKYLSDDLIVHLPFTENHISSYRNVKYDLIQDDPVERMIFHMNPYAPSTIYAVCRSQAWLAAIEMLCANRYSSADTIELQFELSISFQGKTKIIDQLMWLRSAENTTNEEAAILPFSSWYGDSTYSNEVEDFFNITAKTLSDLVNGDSRTIRNGLEKACKAYVSFCEDHFRNNQLCRPDSNTRRFLSPFISQSQKAFIKKSISKLPIPMLQMLPNRIHFRPYIDIAKGLESAGVHVDWDQLSNILEIVREFHNRKPDSP